MSASVHVVDQREFDAQRMTDFRARFLWYAWIVAGINLLSFILNARLIAQNAPMPAVTLDAAMDGFKTIIYLIAGARVRARPTSPSAVLLLVFWLITITGAAQLAVDRITFELRGNSSRQPLTITLPTVIAPLPPSDPPIESRPTTKPSTAPASEPAAPAPAAAPSAMPIAQNPITFQPLSPFHAIPQLSVLSVGMGSILISHLFACVFLPWTPRESLRPMAPLLAVNAAITMLDARAHPIAAVVSVMLSPISVLPGLAVCWLQNRRLKDRFDFMRIRGRYEEMRNDLFQARRIHDSLFPQPVDTGPVRVNYAYEPMFQIGGDFLFLHQDGYVGSANGSSSLSLVLIDVGGHGIAAALTVNRLQGELERVFGENPRATPGEVLAALNHYIHLTLARQGMYATAFCFRFEPDTDRLLYAGAAHPPAMIRRANGELLKIESAAPLLGVFRGGEFDPHPRETSFGAGDLLITFTDGAIEAIDDKQDPMGLSRIEHIVRTHRFAGDPAHHPDLSHAILDAVVDHRAGAATDDTLVVEVARPIAPEAAPTRDSAKPQAIAAG